MSKFKVPINKDGNQVSWGHEWNTTFVDPWEFEATLKYNDFHRGRSALNIEWIDIKTRKTYQSGMSLLHSALLSDNMVNGEISGKFGFKKQGTAVLLTWL